MVLIDVCCHVCNVKSETGAPKRHRLRVEGATYFLLVALYAVMIVFGTLGNVMVILEVAKNAAMRTARQG